ncbi:hypothetical protein EKG95_27295, partial [Salmonella enterica subsp. enterica serovar Aqua]|nr:hypothetical protein [Salmonella enterica subsp. enterica serovar Aqua]
SRGGEIVLNGGDSGVVNQSGTLLADSHTGQGGKITLEGQNIHLAGNSLTSATGKTGGGEVYVGGGWQGKDSRIRNASKVVMDKTATIDVSATDAGNGGTAVLWSDDYTNFRGTVLAKGGTQSGNGGRVETSSHKNLQAFGDVDTSARAGKGEWLLDPTDVTIVSGTDNTGITESSNIFSPSAAGAKVGAGKISEQLNNGANVTIQTSGVNTEGQKGNITIAKDVSITKNTGDDATLTLRADNDILVGGIGVKDDQNVSISSTSGVLNLNLLAGNSVTDGSAQVYLGRKPTISLNGGDFVVGSALGDSGKIKFVAERGMGHTIEAKNIKITATGNGGTDTNGLGLNATGSIDITASSVKSLSDWGHNVTWNAGDHLMVNSAGGINIQSNNNDHPATTTLSGVNGVEINSHNGTLSMAGNTNNKDENSITISSSKGSVSLSGNVQDGSNALSLTSVDITSKDKTTLNGTTYYGKAAELAGLNITAGGDVGISGTAKRLSDETPGRASALGIKLSDSKINSTGGNITLTGFAATDKSHQNISTLEISNSNLTANSSDGKISLNGTTETTTGVRVAGSNFTAASLDIKGVATQQGTGFSLTNSHLKGNLAGLTDVTFSSAGSAAGAMNLLDSSIVTDSNRETLMSWHPENLTRLDMGNKAIFDNNNEGWKRDYSSDGHPNGGWIFDNTQVKAGGLVDLKGVGFTNSTIIVENGDLKIDNVGPALLDGSTVKVSNGNVSVHSSKGNISLNKGNISAGKDISLEADAGNIASTSDGGNNTELKAGGNLTITTKKGNIRFDAKDTVNGGKAILSAADNVVIKSSDGTVDMNGNGKAGLSGVLVEAQKGSVSLSALASTMPVFPYPQAIISVMKLSGVDIQAGGDIGISGKATRTETLVPSGPQKGYSNRQEGLSMSGSQVVSTGGNVTITASSVSPPNGAIGYGTTGSDAMILNKNSISANGGKILLDGTSKYNAGIRSTDNDFSAQSLHIKGVSSAAHSAASTDTGFVLKGGQMNGKLKGMHNVSFSSAGSKAGASNSIDAGIVNYNIQDILDLMKTASPESKTVLDMGGHAIFNDHDNPQKKGWQADFSPDNGSSSGGWTLNNTTLSASGDVDIKNLGFENSTINVKDGYLNIDNKGPLWLTGTNVTAQNNIGLTSTEGGVLISGTGGNPRSVIKSDSGNIQLTGTTGNADASGVSVNHAELQAQEDVTVQGFNNLPGAFRGRGISLSDFNIKGRNLSMEGSSSGAYSGSNGYQPAGIFISPGDNSSITAEKGTITGTDDVNGIVFYNPGVLNLSGNISVNGKDTGGNDVYSAGILFAADNNGAAGLNLNILKGSNVSVSGDGVNQGIAVVGEGNAAGSSLLLTNNSAELKVTGTATGESGKGITVISHANSGSQEKSHIKLSSSGGSTTLSGTADGEQGTGVSKVIIDTGGVTAGEVVISGQGGKDGVTINSGSHISNIQVSGKGNTGTGVLVVGDVAMKDAKVTGKTDTGIATQVAAGAKVTSDKTSELNGESTGTGKGVVLGSEASVSGGMLTATSVDGSGLQVESGSKAEDVKINAQTVNGQAISGDDKALTATGTTSISTVGEAGNTNISDKVKPVTGVTPSGVVAEAFDKLRESIATLKNALNTKSAGLGGLQQTMVTLQKQFDQAVHTGAIGQPDLKRLEIVVNGLSDRLHTATVTVAELNDAISSLKVDDAGMLGENQKTADRLSAGLQGLTLPAAGDISAVAGELNAAKTLQSATVSLQGSLAVRADEDGKVRHLLDSLQQQLKDAQEKGTAGGAVLAGMQAQLDSLDLQQRSYEEALAHIRQNFVTVSQDGSSPVTERQDSVNRLQTALSGVSGIPDGQISALGNQLQQATTGYAQLVTAVQQQGSVNAQMPLQSRDQQDGFHAGGEPMVPVHGYQAQPQNVDIRLCDGEGCRSVTLDVAKPSRGLMVASTESR